MRILPMVLVTAIATLLGVHVPTEAQGPPVVGVKVDKILDEDRKITVMYLPKGYVIVLDIDLHASVCPITFGDTKEGSMAIRIHPEITVKPGKGKMQNADGKINEGSAKDPQCWGY